MTGPTKRWSLACDDRERARELAGIDRETFDRALDAIFRTVFSQPRTTFVGVARFDWTPVRGRTPDGKSFVSRRLRVTPSRYVDQPARRLPVTGDVE